jgi:hypothetical protein
MILRTDQYDLWYGSIRSLERQTPLYVGRYSTACVSATSTRNLTFLAQITSDLHAGEKCKVSRARCYMHVILFVRRYSTVCASILT